MECPARGTTGRGAGGTGGQTPPVRVVRSDGTIATAPPGGKRAALGAAVTQTGAAVMRTGTRR
jgi:hypothetical protein